MTFQLVFHKAEVFTLMFNIWDLRHTDPVDTRFPAELVGLRRAEVVVRPERLVERGDEVENSLPATLVTQRIFPIFTALPKSGQNKKKDKNRC